MGFPTTCLVKPIDPNLICGICSGVLDSPVLTPCGHTFCDSCINKWLETATARTCPECRLEMAKNSVRPILSLKNLILGLEVTCLYKSQGCKEVFRIESQDAHQNECRYANVTCLVCQQDVDKSKFKEHQVFCQISNPIPAQEDKGCEPKTSSLTLPTDGKDASPTRYFEAFTSASRMSFRNHMEDDRSAHITYLLQRINTLERQIARLLDDLHEAHRKNSLLYFQNRQLKEHDFERHRKQYSLTDVKLGLSEDHNSTICQQDIAKLSLYIAKYLLQKPPNVDRDKVFSTIRESYEMQFYLLSKHSTIDHDIHMLLATAYSSNWFTGAQRILLGCWLQCVLKN